MVRVLVEEGQHVSKGQLLAEIDPTDYRNAFNVATAQHAAATAVSQRANAGSAPGTGTGPHRFRAQ